jgi:SAM-dependent methyltransferase
VHIQGLFDEDYLFFYEERIGDERSDSDAELIWNLLELQPGMEVLDLACGHGRIANRLAQRGARVTGLDATPGFLARARRDAAKLGVEADYVEGDMRSLPWSDRFDRIVNWFTAFGYFEDGENRQVLAEAHRALTQHGRLLIENNGLPWVLRNFRPEIVVEREGDFAIDRTEFDPKTGRFQTERTVIRHGKVRKVQFFVRAFIFAELRDWLFHAGFAAVDGYGEDGQPLTTESRRMITVARRSG